MATGHEAFRAMFAASHGSASQSAPGAQAHSTTQGTVHGGAISTTAATGAYGGRTPAGSEGGQILVDDEGQDTQQIDVGGTPVSTNCS